MSTSLDWAHMAGLFTMQLNQTHYYLSSLKLCLTLSSLQVFSWVHHQSWCSEPFSFNPDHFILPYATKRVIVLWHQRGSQTKWTQNAMQRGKDGIVVSNEMSQHLAGSPPAVWNVAADLKWINESLNDSCPVWHHSLVEQCILMGGARRLKERGGGKRVMGGEKTEGWREQRRWRCFKWKLKRLCKSEKLLISSCCSHMVFPDALIKE